MNAAGKLGAHAPKDAFAFSGFATNRCFVVPSLDLIVVRLGYGPQPLGPKDVPLSSIVPAVIR